MKAFNHRRTRRLRRRGTTVVEVAVVLPVFFLFIFGLVEFGRIQLVSNMLRASCRNGVRYGSTEGVTSSEARDRVVQMLSSVTNPEDLAVIVKDAGVYDNGGELPTTAGDYDALPDIELGEAVPRQLILVRASVAYNDIALVPMPVLQGATLTGQAFMRHE